MIPKEQMMDRMLGDAICRLPPETREAYETALKRCPEVCERESNRTRYMKFCQNDPDAAARRLAEYWNIRREVFGPDRCYRPVTDFSSSNNGGALTPRQIEMVHKGREGYFVPPDKDGRMVLVSEYNNIAKHNDKLGVTMQDKLAISFFFFQLPAQEDITLDKGYVLIQIVQEQKHTNSPKVLEMYSRLFHNCLPVHLHCYHLVLIPREIPKTKVRDFSRKVVPFVVQLFKGTLGGVGIVSEKGGVGVVSEKKNNAAAGVHGGQQQQQMQIQYKVHFIDATKQYKGKRAPVHVQKASIARVLQDEKIGLYKSGLPAAAGGDWSFKQTKVAIENMFEFTHKVDDVVAKVAPPPSATTTTTTRPFKVKQDSGGCATCHGVSAKKAALSPPPTTTGRGKKEGGRSNTTDGLEILALAACEKWRAIH